MVVGQVYKISLSPLVSSMLVRVEYLGDNKIGEKQLRVVESKGRYKENDVLELREIRIFSTIRFEDGVQIEEPFVAEKTQVVAKKPVEPVRFNENYKFDGENS